MRAVWCSATGPDPRVVSGMQEGPDRYPTVGRYLTVGRRPYPSGLVEQPRSRFEARGEHAIMFPPFGWTKKEAFVVTVPLRVILRQLHRGGWDRTRAEAVQRATGVR